MSNHARTHSGGNHHLRTRRLHELDLVARIYDGVCGAHEFDSALFGLAGAHAAIHRADRALHAPDGKIAKHLQTRIEKMEQQREERRKKMLQELDGETLQQRQRRLEYAVDDDEDDDDDDSPVATEDDFIVNEVSSSAAAEHKKTMLSEQKFAELHSFPLVLEKEKPKIEANEQHQHQQQQQRLSPSSVLHAQAPVNVPDEAAFFRAWHNNKAPHWGISEALASRKPVVAVTSAVNSSNLKSHSGSIPRDDLSSASLPSRPSQAPSSPSVNSNAAFPSSSVATASGGGVNPAGGANNSDNNNNTAPTSPLLQKKRERLGAVDPLRPWHRTAAVEDTPYESEFLFNSEIVVLQSTEKADSAATSNLFDAPSPFLASSSSLMDQDAFDFRTRSHGRALFDVVVATHKPNLPEKGYLENQDVPVAPGSFFDVRQTEYVCRLRGLLSEIYEPKGPRQQLQQQQREPFASLAASTSSAAAAAATTSAATAAVSPPLSSYGCDEDRTLEPDLEQYKNAPQLTDVNCFSLARTLQKMRSASTARRNPALHRPFLSSQAQVRHLVHRLLRCAQEMTRSGSLPMGDVTHDCIHIFKNSKGGGGRRGCLEQIKVNCIECPEEGIHVRFEESFIKVQLVGLRVVTDPFRIVLKGKNAAMCGNACGLRKRYTILGELTYDPVTGKQTLHPHPDATHLTVPKEQQQQQQNQNQNQGAEEPTSVATRIKQTVGAAFDSASARAEHEEKMKAPVEKRHDNSINDLGGSSKSNTHRRQKQQQRQSHFSEYDLQLDSTDASGTVASALNLSNSDNNNDNDNNSTSTSAAYIPEKLDPATELTTSVRLKQLDVVVSLDLRKKWGAHHDAELVVRDVEVRLRHFSVSAEVKDAPFLTLLAKAALHAMRPILRLLIEGAIRSEMKQFRPRDNDSSSSSSSAEDNDDARNDADDNDDSDNTSIGEINADTVNIVL